MCKGVWGYPYKQYNLSTKDTLHLYCFQSPPTKGQPLSIKQSAKVSICVKPQHTHTHLYYIQSKQTNDHIKGLHTIQRSMGSVLSALQLSIRYTQAHSTLPYRCVNQLGVLCNLKNVYN